MYGPGNGSRRELDYTYTRFGTANRDWRHTLKRACVDGSIPLIGIKAAIAAGFLPYPSRTRKISPPAFRSVLEWETLWEI